MLIAQISDLHLVAEGQRAYGRVDTGAFLDQAMSALDMVSPRPDWVVATGDLVQSGKDEEYARLREVLVELGIPVFPVAGNHDNRSALSRSFAHDIDVAGAGGFIQYAVDLGGLRLVVADTVTEGSDEPSFCEARADWLAATLAASNMPTLIAMHHPPFACGVEWLEPVDPRWAIRLAGVLNHAPQVIRIVAGHVHRAIHATFLGIPASTAPSTAHQVFPGLNVDDEPLLSLEAPGFQLHRWDGAQLVTYTASTAGFGEVFSPAGAAR